MSALKYWIWLTGTVDYTKLLPLLDGFGTPENVYYASPDDYGMLGLAERDINALKNKNLDTAERILERCDVLGVRAVTIQDAEYPDRLKNIYAPPCVLYIKGRMLSYDEEPVVAIVGTRSATPYGLMAAGRVSRQIAMCGGVVVSGLAKGIDTEAHKGALSAGAPTVGVLGCGSDVVFPKENAFLYEDVAATGAIITEYPPGTGPEARHFPARNRIISGISLGTIVVAAPKRSGALITAALALEQGHDVFAVPGNIDCAESEGTNELIKQGAALVTDGFDVLREYEPMFPHKINLKRGGAYDISGAEDVRRVKSGAPPEPLKPVHPVEENTAPVGYIDLTEKIKDFTCEQQNIIVAIAGRARHIDEIIDITGISAGGVLSALTLLEVEGIVRQLPGKRFEFVI